MSRGLLFGHSVQGGPKNRTCLNFGNFATISGRKACDMSKVSE